MVNGKKEWFDEKIKNEMTEFIIFIKKYCYGKKYGALDFLK